MHFLNFIFKISFYNFVGVPAFIQHSSYFHYVADNNIIDNGIININPKIRVFLSCMHEKVQPDCYPPNACL